ncbi:MAG: hypothetical protein M1609_01320, partial [Firmicutes bacterium]|nr:hypothetical protein [Bacillota bacterium]
DQLRKVVKVAAGARKSLDEILMDTGVEREEYELITNGSRRRKLTSAKVDYARAAAAQGYSFEEIARHIGVSAAAVFKYINNRL